MSQQNQTSGIQGGGLRSEENRETWVFGMITYTGCEVAARLMNKALGGEGQVPDAVGVAALLVFDNCGYDADAWLRQVESECDSGGIDQPAALRWFSEQGVTQATRRLARIEKCPACVEGAARSYGGHSHPGYKGRRFYTCRAAS